MIKQRAVESDVGSITSAIDLSGNSVGNRTRKAISMYLVIGAQKRVLKCLELVREVRAAPTPTMSQNQKTNLYSTPQDSSGSVHSLSQTY